MPKVKLLLHELVWCKQHAEKIVEHYAKKYGEKGSGSYNHNKVSSKWNRNADLEIPDLTDTIKIDDEQMSNFAYAPSPFSKQYVPLNTSQSRHFEDPSNELIGMRWGDYAWPNRYLHQTQKVNENPATLTSPFIPFNLPLDIRRLRYLAGYPITHPGSTHHIPKLRS